MARSDAEGGVSRGAGSELAGLIAVTALLLGLHLAAAGVVGYGDSEALYASYALHPQPAYVDHPGLVGLFARLVGGGMAPTPARAHEVTSLLGALFPWGVALAGRACGATWSRSFAAGLVVALVPEVAVGMFAMTPDLLLALTWTGTLAFAAAALRSGPRSPRAAVAFACSGLLAGVAASAKVSGALLFPALALAYGARPASGHARTIGPWAGLVAGMVVAAPVAGYESHAGFPMLRHRLIETQAEAGVSLRNAAALVGGQFVYLGPLVVVLVGWAAREAWRGRRDDAVGSLLVTVCVLTLAALLPLCLWSRVAEPHWIAPAFLTLAIAGARASRGPPRSFVVASCGVSACVVGAVHAWVLIPSLLRLAPPSYDARLDIANELYGWPDAVRVVRDEAFAARAPGAARGDVAVVGPHWVVCAQLEAALEGELPVGCNTPVADDFDRWWPRARWREAETILWVSDGRFGPAPELPEFAAERVRRVPISRGGRATRVFTVTVLTRRALAWRPAAAAAEAPRRAGDRDRGRPRGSES